MIGEDVSGRVSELIEGVRTGTEWDTGWAHSGLELGQL